MPTNNRSAKAAQIVGMFTSPKLETYYIKRKRRNE